MHVHFPKKHSRLPQQRTTGVTGPQNEVRGVVVQKDDQTVGKLRMEEFDNSKAKVAYVITKKLLNV